MDGHLLLDPLAPPKYCPQCAIVGIKSKVKKFKVNPNIDELVIMCKNDKCPWPFSVSSPSEVTVKVDSPVSKGYPSLTNRACKKKRKNNSGLDKEPKDSRSNNESKTGFQAFESTLPELDNSNKEIKEGQKTIDIIEVNSNEIDPRSTESNFSHKSHILEVCKNKKVGRKFVMKDFQSEMADIEQDIDIASESVENTSDEKTSEALKLELTHFEINQEALKPDLTKLKNIPEAFQFDLTKLGKVPDAFQSDLTKLEKIPETPQSDLTNIKKIPKAPKSDLTNLVKDPGSSSQSDLTSLARSSESSPQLLPDTDICINNAVLPPESIMSPTTTPVKDSSFQIKRSTKQTSGLAQCAPTTSASIKSNLEHFSSPKIMPKYITYPVCKSNKSLPDNITPLVQGACNESHLLFDTEVSDELIGATDNHEATSDISIEYAGSLITDITSVEEKEGFDVLRIGHSIQEADRHLTSKGTPLKSLSNKLYLSTGMDIEAEVLPQVSSINLPTLVTSCFETEDPDFVTVRKLGSGVTVDKEMGEMECEEATENIPPAEDCVVFHMASQAMTEQPSDRDSLNLAEQGKTKVWLTEGSNHVEIGKLQNDGKYQCRVNRGRGSGEGQARETNWGSGWFMWRDWKVDGKFIVGFSEYMHNLVQKWNIPKQNKIDPRIQALLKMKETATEDPETIEKVITFFAEVFVKYLYIKTNFPSLSLEKTVDMLHKHYSLGNRQFAAKIRSIMLQQQEPGTIELVSRATQASPPAENGDGDGVTNTPYKQLVSAVKTPKNSIGGLSPSSYPLTAQVSHVLSKSISVQPEDLSRDMNSSFMRNLSADLNCQSDPDDLSSVNTSMSSALNCQQVKSLHHVDSCSVEISSVSSDSHSNSIGQGSKLVQFYYHHPVEDTRTVFPPVQVTSDSEVRCVVALVTEMARTFNYRNCFREKRRTPVKYSSDAAMALSVLDKKIVSHVKRCFTVWGMRNLKVGSVKEKKHQRIKNVFKIYEQKVSVEGSGLQSLGDKSSQAELDEFVPSDTDLKLGMEKQLFGGYLPENGPQGPPRRKASNPEELEAVNLMLGSTDSEQQQEREGIKLSSLFRNRKRGRSKDVENFPGDDDEEYKAPGSCKKGINQIQSRKSGRLSDRQNPAGETRLHNIKQTSSMDMENILSMNVDQCMPATIDSIADEVTATDANLTGNILVIQNAVEKNLKQAPPAIKYNRISNVSENYLKKLNNTAKNAGDLKDAEHRIFDQTFARKKHSEKVSRILEKQKKKSTKLLDKKYKGFGGKEVECGEDKIKEKIKKEKNIRKIKKAQVTKSEVDLIEELLKIGEAAVESSKTNDKTFQSRDNNCIDAAAIQEVDEFQSIGIDLDFLS